MGGGAEVVVLGFDVRWIALVFFGFNLLLPVCGHSDILALSGTTECQAWLSAPGRWRSLMEAVRRVSPENHEENLKRILEWIEARDLPLQLEGKDGVSASLLSRVVQSGIESINDRIELRSLTETLIKESRAANSLRDKLAGETVKYRSPDLMVRVPAGKVSTGKLRVRVDGYPGNTDLEPNTVLEVPSDFQVMQAPVTQIQWLRVMKGVPSFDNVRGLEGKLERVAFGGKEHELGPHLPIVNVSVYSMAEFANRLSLAHGLRPAYVLEGLTGDAADGTLVAQKMSVVSDNFDQVEGFRFPTVTEMLLMTSSIREDLDHLHYHQQHTRILDYGWFRENSDKNLMEVGLKEPVLIDGLQVFDLIGLVTVPCHLVDLSSVLGEGWTRMLTEKQDFHPMLVRRMGEFEDIAASYYGDPRIERLARRSDNYFYRLLYGHGPLPVQGFRLVRTLK